MLTSRWSPPVTPSVAELTKIQCDDSGQRQQAVSCTVAWSWARDEPEHRRWLDAAERERYERLRVPAARARFVTGRALARSMVGAATSADPRSVRLACRCRTCGAAHGRPSAIDSGLDFSISHCGAVVGVAIIDAGASVRVGLDVEDAGPARAARAGELAGLGDVTLSPDERPEVLGGSGLGHAERWRRFARYWCRKEALVKADGVGLDLDLTTVTVSPPDAAPAIVRWPRPGVPTLVDVAVPAPPSLADSPWVAAVCVLAAAAVRIDLTVAPPPQSFRPVTPALLNGAR